MLRGIPPVVLALSVAVVAGYVEVYVEDGPDLDGLHIYAWDGKSPLCIYQLWWYTARSRLHVL